MPLYREGGPHSRRVEGHGSRVRDDEGRLLAIVNSTHLVGRRRPPAG